MNMKCGSLDQTRRGFTLTEFAIILGVFSAVITGVWEVAAWGAESMKQKRLSEEIYATVRDVRALYAGRISISGDVATLVPQLVAQNAVSSDMVRTSGGCSNGSCLDNPWGPSTASANGSFQVCGWTPGKPGVSSGSSACTVGATSQFFAIEVVGLPVSSCINVVLQNSGALAPPGLVDVVFNNATSIINSTGPTHQLPVSVADANAYCTAGGAIDFVFRLLPPQL